MDKSELRFSLSSEKYLEKSCVMVYLEDAIAQLLEHKEENPKVSPSKFFSNYFNSVKAGNHVLLREYSYVKATLHNRSSFVRTVWKCFCNIGRKGDLLSIKEYHSLICLLCPDFPFSIVQKTARIILMDDALDSLISFADFLYAFQIQFCYEEFLSRCSELYRSLMQNVTASHETVVVPTSEERPQVVSQQQDKAESSSNGVDSVQYARNITAVCEKLDTSAPPVKLLQGLMSSSERTTFYGFLNALSKCADLNVQIGKLPSRSELFTISEQDVVSATASQTGWSDVTMTSSAGTTTNRSGRSSASTSRVHNPSRKPMHSVTRRKTNKPRTHKLSSNTDDDNMDDDNNDSDDDDDDDDDSDDTDKL